MLFRSENIILQLSKKAKILDFGCGYGRICQKVWRMGYRNVVGYDCSPRMIERGQLECFSHSETKIFDAESLGGSPARAILFSGEKSKNAFT